MSFKQGNKYGRGRPKGSQNKLTKANKEFLHHLIFDQQQMLEDWLQLDLYGRMELRTKLAPYILAKAKDETFSRIETDEPPIKKVWAKFGIETPDKPDDYFTFNQLMADMSYKELDDEAEISTNDEK